MIFGLGLPGQQTVKDFFGFRGRTGWSDALCDSVTSAEPVAERRRSVHYSGPPRGATPCSANAIASPGGCRSGGPSPPGAPGTRLTAPGFFRAEKSHLGERDRGPPFGESKLSLPSGSGSAAVRPLVNRPNFLLRPTRKKPAPKHLPRAFPSSQDS